MMTVTFRVQGMHCSGCAATIQALLQHSTGVHSTAVSFEKGEARVLFDPRAVSRAQLAQAIVNAGFRVTGEQRG